MSRLECEVRLIFNALKIGTNIPDSMFNEFISRFQHLKNREYNNYLVDEAKEICEQFIKENSYIGVP